MKKIKFNNLGTALMGLFSANPDLDASTQETLISAAEQDAEAHLGDTGKGESDKKDNKETGEVTVEALQTQIQEKDAKIIELQTKADKIPDLEAKVQKLGELEAEAKQLREWKTNYEAGVHGGDAGDRTNGDQKEKTSYQKRAEAKAAEMEELKAKYPDMFE